MGEGSETKQALVCKRYYPSFQFYSIPSSPPKSASRGSGEDEWRAALDTAQWGLPCAPPQHTTHFADPRPGIQASASGPSSVQVPTTLRAALGMQRSNAYTCWNSEPQTQWDSLWLKAVLMGKARVYGHTLPGSRCKQTKCERPFSRKLLKLGRAWVSSITCLW